MNTDMTIADAIKKWNPCRESIAWATRNCPSGMMSEAYDKLLTLDDEETNAFFRWAWPRVFDAKTRALICVRIIRETPLHDGRFVADLLTDRRRLDAIAVLERWAYGKATDEELKVAAHAARAAAYAAAYAADAVADAVARATGAVARAVAYATDAVAYAVAYATDAAQKKIIASFGNPFRGNNE